MYQKVPPAKASAPSAEKRNRRRRDRFALGSAIPAWPAVTGRFGLAALRCAGVAVTEVALMGAPYFGLHAASLAGQVRDSGERKAGDVVGNFFDLSLADFKIRV